MATETETEAEVAREDGKRADQEEKPIKEVRASDIEPYTGLRYLSKLFRFMAIIVILLIIAEVVTGLSAQGAAAIPTLLGEVSRLIVLAGVLWGTGDLALLLIDVGHDVRASRILLARQTYHLTSDRGEDERHTASGMIVDGTFGTADRAVGVGAVDRTAVAADRTAVAADRKRMDEPPLP